MTLNSQKKKKVFILALISLLNCNYTMQTGCGLGWLKGGRQSSKNASIYNQSHILLSFLHRLCWDIHRLCTHTNRWTFVYKLALNIMSILPECPPVPRQTSTTHPVQWDYTSPHSLPPHTCLLYKAGYEYICHSPALRRSSCTLWATAGGNWRWKTGKSIEPGFQTNGICGQRGSRAHCRSYFTLTQTRFTISQRSTSTKKRKKKHTHTWKLNIGYTYR